MKKLMLLALAVASAAALMVPASASALESLHMSPTPTSLDVAGVGNATLRSSAGTVTCEGVGGTVTPAEGGTTGTLNLTFGPNCKGPGGGTCTSTSPAETSGNIKTTELDYHLVTLPDGSPAVLVTPNTTTGTFAHFNCIILGVPVQITVGGNGVIGTITEPECGATSGTSTLSFTATGTTQNHRHVAGTETTYSLSVNGNPASQEGHATLTATGAEPELVCT